MTLASDVINDALKEIGVLAEGDTASAAMSNDALRALNRLMDILSNGQSFAFYQSLITRTLTGESSFYIGPALSAVFSVTLASPGVFTSVAHGLGIGDTVTFTTTGALPTGLTVGTTYYIITAGFTADTFEVSLTSGGTAVNTSVSQSGVHTFTQTYSTTRVLTLRPIHIESAYAERSGIHYPIRIIDNQIWDSIIYQSAPGANTVYVYYEPRMPNGLIYLWPIASGCTVNLRIINQVATFATLSTALILPPGYEECLMRNLAVRIAPQYPAGVLSPITVQLAKTSLNTIQRQNNVIPTLTLPSAVTGNRNNGNLASFIGGM